jgi:tetratricopeptide (TPR) repeat protein
MKETEAVEKLINNKEYKKAIELLSSLIETDKENSKWLNMRGDIYYLHQDYPNALNDFLKVLKTDSESKNIASKIEMIKEILKFQALDIYGSTNMNLDPWLDY